MKYLRLFATPWPVHAGIAISALLFAIDVKVDSIYLALRIALGIALYPLALTVTIGSYYYMKLARLLEKTIKSQQEKRKTITSDSKVYEEWRNIAQLSRGLSYYAGILGGLGWFGVLFFTVFDLVSIPWAYFLFLFGFVGFALIGAFILFSLQFTRNACFSLKESVRITRRLSKGITVRRSSRKSSAPALKRTSLSKSSKSSKQISSPDLSNEIGESGHYEV